MSHSVCARLTSTEVAHLDDLAGRSGRSRSSMIRALVCDAVGMPEPEPSRGWPAAWFGDRQIAKGDLIRVDGLQYRVIEAGPSRIIGVLAE